jgi:hypothetical protein
MEYLLNTEEAKPKNYLNLFIELLNKDEFFKNEINDLKTNELFKNENDRYVKYINKPSTDEFYKTYLYQHYQRIKLEALIIYINTKLKYDDEYKELKKHYYAPSRGSCVMGCRLYYYGIPKNLRKNIPDDITLFSLGYSNGQMEKEYIQETFKRVLDAFDVKILYDCGRMD